MSREETDRLDQPAGKLMWRNFLGGIAWGLGATIGATIILACIGYFVSKVNYIPIVGNFVTQVVEFVETNSQPPGTQNSTEE